MPTMIDAAGMVDLIGVLRKYILRSEEAAASSELSTLNREAQEQSVALQLAQLQAKVGQEIAIAQRIANADEVHIEEYYEGEGKGGLVSAQMREP